MSMEEKIWENTQLMGDLACVWVGVGMSAVGGEEEEEEMKEETK